jgi:hypothetical protein
MSFSQSCMKGVVGALNAGGSTLRRIGLDLPALELEPLLEAARQRTGLREFGDWDFIEPLQRLLASYRSEAALTTLGRVTVKELIVSLLENLLQLEAEYRRSPGIASIDIESPVFIIGLPRTGTTLLHGLMSEDSDNRVPRTWEVMYPARFPNDADGIAQARRLTASRLAWANRLAPKFRKIHPIAADLPQECIAITAQVFMSIQFHTTHNVPSYERWFERSSQKLGYEFHRRLLQHLEARAPGRRWVLKAPGHLFALDDLLARYPDAKIVQTHRDPLRVVASMASHATVLRRAFSDSAEPGQIAADWTERWARALTDFLAVRDRFPAAQFLDINYHDLEHAPLDTVAAIYDFLGWPVTEASRAAMGAFLRANPKNKHGVHRYSLSQYGLDKEAEAERFAAYCSRFNIAVHADV